MCKINLNDQSTTIYATYEGKKFANYSICVPLYVVATIFPSAYTYLKSTNQSPNNVAKLEKVTCIFTQLYNVWTMNHALVSFGNEFNFLLHNHRSLDVK